MEWKSNDTRTNITSGIPPRSHTRTWCARNDSKGVNALSRSGDHTGYEFYDFHLRSRQAQTPSSTGGPA
ncbi:hypothetical protein ACFY9X_34965 [Streptomyces nigra]|uniref:hypothetical protein n=1 Tax=Streptomyces nigra TaxID=1827580 RepID=UPI0036E79B0E